MQRLAQSELVVREYSLLHLQKEGGNVSVSWGA